MALLPEDMGCAGTDPAGDMAVQRISERREKEKNRVKKKNGIKIEGLEKPKTDISEGEEEEEY